MPADSPKVNPVGSGDRCYVTLGYFQRQSSKYGVACISRFPSDPLWVCLFTPSFLNLFIPSAGTGCSQSLDLGIRPNFTSFTGHRCLPPVGYVTCLSLSFPIHEMGAYATYYLRGCREVPMRCCAPRAFQYPAHDIYLYLNTIS